MPMPRPSLRDLVARLEAEIESRLPALDARLRHSYVGVLAKSIAGAHHEMYGYLAWVEAQAFPDQAELESLERWAVIWGVARHPAVAATGNVSVTGSAGARVPSGTIWLRSDGVEYRVTTATDVGAGATDVPVTSVTPGRIGNVAAGRATLRSPILGVVSRGVVEATGGADAEGVGQRGLVDDVALGVEGPGGEVRGRRRRGGDRGAGGRGRDGPRLSGPETLLQ